MANAPRLIKQLPGYVRLRTELHRVETRLHARAARDTLESLQRFCLFIGHGRSGHSIVGALLDAHKSIVMPDEIDVLAYLQAGFSGEQIVALLLWASRRQARQGRSKHGRDGKRYTGYVAGQWQGRSEQPLVAGSSKAGVTVARLAHQPQLLATLEERLRLPLCAIHIVRHPLDNIATIHLRRGLAPAVAAEQYFVTCDRLLALRSHFAADELVSARHEDLIAQPLPTLQRLCRFLNVSADEAYLTAAAAIVFKSRQRSSEKVAWPAGLREQIEQKAAKYSFLDGYRNEW